jgi:hypothetical protein
MSIRFGPSPGRIAYEEHSACFEGKCPWDELDTEEQMAWESVAQAVLQARQEGQI